MVHIQDGPLYRVKGYAISISCDVTGYIGEPDQTFAFSVYKSDFPDREIKIISTGDPNYAYSAYTMRVKNKDIEIKRLSTTSVLLQLTSLLAEDAGTYECFTENQFDAFSGTYFAKTTLNGNDCFHCISNIYNLVL